MTLRIGVLGAARIAERALIVPAHEAGHRVVAVGARDGDRARAFAARHGIERAYGSYDEVLADPDVDVVYNALVNSLHAPWNTRAVLAGSRGQVEAPCFVLPHLDERLLVTIGSTERPEWVTGPTSYACQLAALDAAVRGSAAPPLGPEDPVATMDLVDATYRAAGMQPRPGGVEI